MTSIGMSAETPVRAIRAIHVTAAALALALAASGCATGNRFETSAHFDTEYDFASVETFAFEGVRPRTSQTVNGRIIEMTLREELLSRGYGEAPADQADVFVTYDYGRYAPAKLSGSNSFVINRGTLTVSVIDPGSGRTVWHGWVETNIRPEDDGEVVIAEATETLLRNHLTRARKTSKASSAAATVAKKTSAAEKDVDAAMDAALDDAKGK